MTMPISNTQQTTINQPIQRPQPARQPAAEPQPAMAVDRATLRPLRTALGVLSLSTATVAGTAGGAIACHGLAATKLVPAGAFSAGMAAMGGAVAGHVGARYSETLKGSMRNGALVGGAVAVGLGILTGVNASSALQSALGAGLIGAASGAVAGAVEHAWYRK